MAKLRPFVALGLVCLSTVACATGRNRGGDAGRATPDTGLAHDGGGTPGDGGRDAGTMPGMDAGTMPGMDAGTMPTDAGRDAAAPPTDAGRDAPTLPTDAGSDAGRDAGSDAGHDAGNDAAVVGPCAGGDCTACGGGNFCAAGVCGANPTMLGYDFENGMLPTGWTNGTGGTTPWRMSTTTAHGGTHAGQAGAISDGGSSGASFSITLASAATISFWVMTSSESGFDYLRFLVDGTEQGSWSGTTAWTQASFLLAAGTHTIEWRYTKDGSLSSGSDTAWVDDVTITSGGAGYATGFETTSLPAGYTTSGSASWTTSTTSFHGGARSAQSGDITDSQTTSMTTTVTLPSASTLTFWYSVSSESGFDYLGVYVDGTLQSQWSGTVGWTMASYPIAAGTHTVEWRYSKDGSLSNGSDAAWVDDIDFGYVPTVGPLCM